jgi:4-hydroxybenzoate polyprenyltransferase
VGYFIATGAERWADDPGKGLAAALLWAVCLNGGTLALNSAVDRDGGDVGYLDRPPPPPPGLYLFGAAVMAAGQLGALLISPRYASFYALCVLLSLAYSTPPLRLKARPGWDLLVNCAGYGALTTLAGWAAAAPDGAPLGPMALIAAGYFALFAALYPLTQIYQHDDDAARGDRTLTVRLGVRGALRLSLASLGAAFALFAAAARGLGPSAWWLALPLAAWLAVLVPWSFRHARGRAYPEKKGMYRALWAWGLTDVVWILLAVGL